MRVTIRMAYGCGWREAITRYVEAGLVAGGVLSTGNPSMSVKDRHAAVTLFFDIDIPNNKEDGAIQNQPLPASFSAGRR
jgi:hypothetical protein